MAVITTIRSISEQISRLYIKAVDRENIKPNIEKQEIIPLVIQSCNKILAVQPLDRYGEIKVRDINSLMIASYTVAVNAVGSAYKSVLPVRPIRLPHDMGVWEVYADGDFSSPFIPVPTQYWSLISNMKESLLEGQIGFYCDGGEIYYTKNPIATNVRIKMLVVDPNTLADTDPLPVTKEMESEIVEDVLKVLLITRQFPQLEDNTISRVAPQQETEG